MHRGRVVSVIDVGSNSIRLLVARQLAASAFEVIDEEKYDAKLGQGQVNGLLSEDGMERGMRALRIVSQVSASHSPQATVAAGTEALRRAPNASEFCNRVYDELGVDLRILSGEEEARASFLGAMNSTSIEDGHLVDIGGGSLEVVRIRGRQPVSVQSVPLGAIYATEKYLPDDPPTARQVRALRKAVGKLVHIEEKLPVMLGAGGAVRNLARLHRMRTTYPLRRMHGMEIPVTELTRMARQLLVPTAARRKLPGMSQHRVETLPAAAIVLDEVAKLTGAQNLTVAGQGLREGLLWQVIRPVEPLLPNVRRSSIDGLSRANHVDERATEPVEATASALFDATHDLHGFGAEYRELLLCAARLAGIGMHIDYYNRDRHAEYLVHSGDLHGFTHREIVILGALVRWGDSGSPDLSMYSRALRPDDQACATALAPLLGIAHAIHRRQKSPIVSVQANHRTGRNLRLTVRANTPLDAEMNALDTQARRFESVYKLPLQVVLQLAQDGARERKSAG